MISYLNEITRTDVQRVDGVRRDPARVERVLRSLARNVATAVTTSTLAADAGIAGSPLEHQTVSEYTGALQRLMITEDVPAWSPSLRSRARLRTAVVRHFTDPCLAVAALRAAPAQLLGDLNYLGFLFENLVVRDLRVYLQPLGARLFHYRDSNDLEVDIIVELEDGRWGGVEVKLGNAQVDAAARCLAKAGQPARHDASGRAGLGRGDGHRVRVHARGWRPCAADQHAGSLTFSVGVGER